MSRGLTVRSRHRAATLAASRWATASLVCCTLASCARSTGRVEVGVDASADAAAPDGDMHDRSPRDGSGPDAMPSLEGGMYTCAAPHFAAPGYCDTPSQARCQSWAERVGAGWVDPLATCFDPGYIASAMAYCVRGNPGCGSGPPCEVYQVCARRSAGAPYECLPCSAN